MLAEELNPITITEANNRLLHGETLNHSEMRALVRTIMSGGASEAQLGGFLMALHQRGETMEELVATVQIMRELMTPVEVSKEHLVDLAGTGGDGAKMFNISTAAALVAAAAGARVAKHGNRSVSSTSGSADVLEASGVHIAMPPRHVQNCIETLGIGFIYAPDYHPAMAQVGKVRKELGVRTCFNLLGPLVNPASPPSQIIGVPDAKYLTLMAEVLRETGSRHSMVVYSKDGLDEISIAAETHIVELKEGKIIEYLLYPDDLDINIASLDELRVGNVAESLQIIKDGLRGKNPAARDIIALNAGAAIYVAGVEPSIRSAVDAAQSAIGSGIAYEKLQNLVAMTGSMVGTMARPEVAAQPARSASGGAEAGADAETDPFADIDDPLGDAPDSDAEPVAPDDPKDDQQ